MTSFSLPYDHEDFGLNMLELRHKYGTAGEHPEYTIDQWNSGANHDHPSNGYWDWVHSQIAEDDEEMLCSLEPLD